MSRQKFTKEYGKLIDRFNEYMIKHPNRVPYGSYIFITSKDMPEFNEKIFDMARNTRTKKLKIEAQHSGSRWLIRPLTL